MINDFPRNGSRGAFLAALAAKLLRCLPLVATFGLLLCLSAAFTPGAEDSPTALVAKCALRSAWIALFLAWVAVDRRWLRRVTALALAVLAFADFYCVFHLHCRVNPSVIFLLFQTDGREAGEYLSEFLLTVPTLKALAVAVIVPVAGLALQRRWSRLKWPVIGPKIAAAMIMAAIVLAVVSLLNTFVTATHTALWALIGAVVGSIVLAACRVVSSRAVEVACWALLALSVYPYRLPLPQADRLKEKKQNAVQNLALSVADVLDSEIDIDRLTAANTDIIAVRGRDDGLKMVVIIGESFNRLHSSLYGYRLDTNPRLAAERDRGNLVVMTAAQSPTESTGYAMRGLLSTHPYGGGSALQWEDYPLLPALMRKAGYRVALIDNQGTMTESDAWQFHSSSFFSTPRMSGLCFDWRNDSVTTYDHEVIDRYLDQMVKADLCIIHLMGQHAPARLRYPAAQARFSADSYPWRDDLDADRLATLAHYDNATAYNDSVVASVIDRYRGEKALVIYLSDHGEAVFDDGLGYGRTKGMVSHAYLRSVYHVPFMVWMSDAFISASADEAEALRQAADRRLCSFDLPHLVMDIYGVDTPWLVAGRSVVSPEYKAHSCPLIPNR